MRTLLRCPYGHDSEFAQMKIEANWQDIWLMNITCQQCGRVYQIKTTSVDMRGLYATGEQDVVVARSSFTEIYELNGPWTGKELTIVTVQE